MWSVKEKGTKQFLGRSYRVKVEVEELEDLLGPDDVDVDFRRILKKARDERGCEIFETFSSDDSWWLSGGDGTSTKERHGDKIRWHLQEVDGGKQAWDSLRNRRKSVGAKMKKKKKKVMDAVEDCVQKCAHVIVKIDFVQSLLRPENLKVSSRVRLEARKLRV